MARKLCILLLASLLLLPGCGVKERWQTSTILAFDTICEINIFCSPSMFKSAQEEVQRVFSEIESLFSPGTDDYSSPLVLDLFQRGLKVYHDSNGCFDVTVGPLSRVWGFFDKSYVVPAPEQIKSALKLIGMEKIEQKNEALVLLPGMELDWGAIAKGFGIDLASKSLIQLGISRGFINAGGDLYCWGKNPSDQSWNIGIKHPRESGFLGVLSISNLGAATTGDYQRYFVKDGVRYHHVFNPRTGYPAQGKQSVTVCGPETLICDALSTALFVSQEPAKILEKYPDYGAIIVDSDGNLSFLGKAYPFNPME
ncbi:MAG: FAD:protein FMN transferase [Desulfatiglandales bacterium]